MNQRVWTYKSEDCTFWISREPIFDPGAIADGRPVEEIGTALIEPYELSPGTRERFSEMGIARLSEWDGDAVLLRLEPTNLQAAWSLSRRE